MHFLDALILGIVEGLTEFLPVSSTGHLILVSEILGLTGSAFLSTFEVVIQLGAILAVVALYFRRLTRDWQLNKRLVVALVPSLIVGSLFYPFIKSLFASPLVVVVALFVGGILMIGLERFQQGKPKSVRTLEGVSYRQAFLVGICQAFAVIPGVSRAAATILGGLAFGFERSVIVEFSFLLAVPTMLAASVFDLSQSTFVWTSQEVLLLATGFVAAFLIALLAVRFLISFSKKHTFVSFGIYRMLVAIVFFLFFL